MKNEWIEKWKKNGQFCIIVLSWLTSSQYYVTSHMVWCNATKCLHHYCEPALLFLSLTSSFLLPPTFPPSNPLSLGLSLSPSLHPSIHLSFLSSLYLSLTHPVLPMSGPNAGGTSVRVRGTNLATKQSEIEYIKINGIFCNISNGTYVPGVRLVYFINRCNFSHYVMMM